MTASRQRPNPEDENLRLIAAEMDRRQQQARNTLLKSPPGNTTPAAGRETDRLLREAEHTIARLQATPANAEVWRAICEVEAQYSAAIEGESDPARTAVHATALESLLKKTPSEESMLALHTELMADQPRTQPGEYRNIEVKVGRHRPPAPELVPELMADLYGYIEKSTDTPLTKAAWAHIQFETIHPFRDGNGRTGRALTNQILRWPLPMSIEILRDRRRYYTVLQQANWPIYLEWFVKTADRTARLTETGTTTK